jgi:hypothetical protein
MLKFDNNISNSFKLIKLVYYISESKLISFAIVLEKVRGVYGQRIRISELNCVRFS